MKRRKKPNNSHKKPDKKTPLQTNYANLGNNHPKLVVRVSQHKLRQVHQDKAKEIVKAHRKTLSCRECFGKGYTGVNEFNEIIPCECVDIEKAKAEWEAYELTQGNLYKD